MTTPTTKCDWCGTTFERTLINGHHKGYCSALCKTKLELQARDWLQGVLDRAALKTHERVAGNEGNAG